MTGIKGFIAVLVRITVRIMVRSAATVVALLFAIQAVLMPQAVAMGKDVLLDELYEQAELERQLQWIKASMTLDYSAYSLPDSVLDTVNQVVRVRYSPSFFRVSMISTLDEALTVDELLTLVEWYDSPLGKKILRLEGQANNPVNVRRIQAYIDDKLSRQLPRSSRTELIEELMLTLDVVEHGTELAATASVGAQRLLREVMPLIVPRQTRPPQVLKAQEKPAIRRALSEKMKSILFFTYRGLSDQEIRRYLDFARSTAMQNFQRGQVQAMARML